METQTQYQYSSLFTSGLLMAPAPRFPVTSLEVSQPHPSSNNSQNIPLAKRRECKLPEPLLVNAQCGNSPQRKLAHRRRSSVTLQLSPRGGLISPTKAAEEAWERARRSSSSTGSTLTASNALRANIGTGVVEPNQIDQKQLLASDFSAMSGATERIVLVKAVYTQPSFIVRKRNKRVIAPKPKPAPTSPLPAIPTFHVSPPPSSARLPIDEMQTEE